jgi:hypothetical protein
MEIDPLSDDEHDVMDHEECEYDFDDRSDHDYEGEFSNDNGSGVHEFDYNESNDNDLPFDDEAYNDYDDNDLPFDDEAYNDYDDYNYAYDDQHGHAPSSPHSGTSSSRTPRSSPNPDNNDAESEEVRRTYHPHINGMC